MQPWMLGSVALFASVAAQCLNGTDKLGIAPSPATNWTENWFLRKPTSSGFLSWDILAGLQPACDTIVNLSHIFYSEFPKWAQLVF